MPLERDELDELEDEIEDEIEGESASASAPPIAWDIHREGRAWTGPEGRARIDRLMGVNVEVSGGKLFWSEKTRRLVLGMLLENVGMDAAVRLGDPAAWKAAVDAMLAEKAGSGSQSGG